MTVGFARMESPVGALLIYAANGSLCGLAFADRYDGLKRDLNRRFGGEPVEDEADPAGAVSRLAAYFAGDLDALFFLSSPRSRHGQNLQANPRVAVAINEDEHEWRDIRGVQLEGTCALASSPGVWLRGWRTYLAKFPVARDLFRGRAGSGVAKTVANTRLYVVRPERVFYLDNRLGFGQRQEVPLPPGARSAPLDG